MITMESETKYIMTVEEDGEIYFVGRNKFVPGKFTLFENSCDALKAFDINSAETVAKYYERDSEGARVKIYPVHVTYEVDDV